jgi:periplasmic protein TonB
MKVAIVLLVSALMLAGCKTIEVKEWRESPKSNITGVIAKPLNLANATFPPTALKNGIQGWVHVEFNLSDTGKAENPVVVSSYPKGVFEESALNSMKKSTFFSDNLNAVGNRQNYVWEFRIK